MESFLIYIFRFYKENNIQKMNNFPMFFNKIHTDIFRK